MGLEIECKLKVDSHVGVRARLVTRGAERIGAAAEVNRLFDRADGALRAAGCGLRVRETATRGSESVVPGDGGSSTTHPAPRAALLTFKGPVRDGAFKRREEIECGVSDAAAMQAVLEALGFVETLTFEKRREEWRLGPCLVELDEVPHLGCFVEIEGPDETAIVDAMRSLDLDSAAMEPRTYVALLAAHAAAHGLDPRNIRFA